METTTDINGSYQFEDILVEQLKNYYVEFTYNGMSYTSVKINAQDLVLANSSKAAEGTARDTYNNKYAMIGSDNSMTSNGTTTNKLTYTSKDHTSSIKYGDNLKYGYKGAEDPINGTYDQYLIQSNTKNGYDGYLNSIVLEEEWEKKYAGANKVENYIRGEGIETIENINLGLRKREQPNLSVVKDIQSAKVRINGAEHIYQYAQRTTQSGIDIYGDGHDIAVKFGTKYGNMSYTRAIYASDIKYTKNNKLQVKVTYKIEVKNQATTLDAVVYELKDYYDTKYEVVNVGTRINYDGSIQNGTNIQYSKLPENEENYEEISIVPKLEIPSQSSKSIYVELNVKPEKILDLVDDGSKDVVKLDNVTEIGRYGTKQSEKVYAGIDKNSKPGNTLPGDTKTYEDDTDQAPGLKLVLQEEREITGTVFEDKSTTGEDKIAGQIRQGNGKLDSSEKGISGVTVQLLSKNTGSNDYALAQMYDSTKKEWVDAVTTTDANGDFRFGGFIPGNYEVRYIWGDKTYKVQNYKGTIVDKDTYETNLKNDQWYKTNMDTRNSDAIDNYDIRTKIDEQVKVETNSTSQKVNDSYNARTSTEQISADVDGDGIVNWLDATFVLSYDAGYRNSTNGKGDLNKDGKVNYNDAVLIMQLEEYIKNASSQIVNLTDTQKEKADIDKNGIVNLDDAMLIMLYVEHNVGIPVGTGDANEDGVINNNDVMQVINSLASTRMESTTPEFKVNLEYDINSTGIKDEYEISEDGTVSKKDDGTEISKVGFKNKIRNIDFGVVERARQVLKIEKQIEKATIILANGNPLIEAEFENGKLKQETKYVSAISKSEGANGQIKMEIDNELVQGASLGITYGFKIVNESEVEYLTKEYYLYGSGHNETNIVEISPDLIIDYLDNKIVRDTSKTGTWNEMSSDEKKEFLGEDAKKYADSVNKVLKTNMLENKRLEPTQTYINVNDKIVLYCSKLLSNSDETISENNSEIIKSSKNGGAQLIVTPGNYIPADATTYEDDSSKSESLIILPPTGQNINIIAYIILGISSLGILVVGIIIIKKKIL